MQGQGEGMSSDEKLNGAKADIYEQLTTARNYLRTLDDFYARAAAEHNTTFEHYQVLLAVHCLGETTVPLRVLAEHLVRDRTATGQLCKRMQQLGLLELTYESNSHRPQLLVSLSERGKEVLKAITEDGLRNRDQYLNTLPADKRIYLAEAVRFSWLEGLEQTTAFSSPKTLTGH
ncbi:MAG TPA: MarR family winged helix-turn-helix transcriptional regulator [Blastocatellia bacterium]|jgi:DNA-binding MarR family transcriptional regulator|nr:MarR family winged helix-turn-helix transcriptional regulator [Blastocatellia bacterium]